MQYNDTIIIRKASVLDIDAIADLYRTQLGRDPDIARITDYINNYPACVAEVPNTGTIAFVFTTRFGPDVLEIANILVSSQWRNKEIGANMLGVLESYAKDKYSALILINSMLYSTVGKKRLAENFYLKCGYKIMLKTDNSIVFGKNI